MFKLVLSAAIICGFVFSAQARERDGHCKEPGAGTLFTRSAFAHGYRHGYEAGYHVGDIDINMARPPRTQYKEFKGLPLGYERSFGSKKSFELGFALGLEAGYGDGYAGKTFRAIDSLRAIGESLSAHPGRGDPGNISFDRGVTLGYEDGLAASHSGRSEIIPADISSVECSFHVDRNKQIPAKTSYCDGYRRGFVLGQSDGLDLSPEQMLLEASR
jgi:hypothetical protein